MVPHPGQRVTTAANVLPATRRESTAPRLEDVEYVAR
jgi:hypothetical protein